MHRVLGNLQEAKEKALSGHDRTLGPDHYLTLNSVNSELHRFQVNLKEAKYLHERALRGYERTVWPDHSCRLSSISNLALPFYAQGNLKEAKILFERAYEGFDELWDFFMLTLEPLVKI